MFCPFCGNALDDIGTFCLSCGGNIHFLRNAQNEPVSEDHLEDELIHKYFKDGHKYDIILELLRTNHNIFLSRNTLKRRLKSLQLSRRNNYTPIAIVRAVISEELRGPGQLLGYRSMHQVLQQKYSMTVKRDDVMHLMAELDPAGIQQRSTHRFVRRGYYSMGPNQVWHIDGYDKLKPYGVAISACIDGFSRKVMWLKCGSSNNDPRIIAQNYLQCVSEFGILPERLRTDCGTDNGVMAAVHCALRSDHLDEFAGARSHMYGSSTSNQRIESWWSCFRKQKTQFWMDLFSDLRERQLFNGSYEHTCLLRYSFLEVLQKELDDYKQLWNTHTIRPVRQSYCPSGKPEAMYYLPERFNGRNCGFAVSQLTLNQFDTMVPDHFSLCGDDNHQNHFEELQRQSGLTAPTDWTEAVEHYITLKSLVGD